MPEIKPMYTAPLIKDVCLWLSAQRLPEKQEVTTAKEILDLAYDFSGFGVYQSIAPSPGFPEERVAENKAEYASLAEEVAERNPKTILEIGTARGGSLFLWSLYFDSMSKIVCLELGSHIEHFEERTRLFDRFADVDMEFLIADSHSLSTREETKRLLNDEPVDFLFIDGDHSYEGVKSDFEMYQDLVSDDGVIGFHDIVNEEWPGVGQLWREIKPEYETTEIIKPPERLGVGIVELGK